MSKSPIIGRIRGDIDNGEGEVKLSDDFEKLVKDDPLTFCDVISDVIWELQCLHQMALEELLISYKKARS